LPQSAPNEFKQIWKEYQKSNAADRKRIAGNTYVAVMKRVLEYAKSKNSVRGELKNSPKLKNRLRPMGSRNTVAKYNNLIGSVENKVARGRDLGGTLWVDELEINMFARMYGLHITVEFVADKGGSFFQEYGKRKGTAKIGVKLQSYHYTPSPPINPSTPARTRNTQQSGRHSERRGTNGTGDNSPSSSIKVEIGNNRSNTTPENRRNTVNLEWNSAGTGSVGFGSNSNKSNRTRESEERKGSGHPNFDNFNLVANNIFRNVDGSKGHHWYGVPLDVLDGAQEYGFGSVEFERLFRKHVNSLPWSTQCATNGSSTKLSRAQVDVYERAKTMASLSIDPEHAYRGLLIHANTGSGKTTMAMAIFLAYWKTGRTMYVITTKDNQDNNNPTQYIQNLKRFFPSHYRVLLGKYGSDEEIRDQVFLVVPSTKTRKLKKINFVTLEIFANKLGYRSGQEVFDRNEKAVVVFDESHNLFQEIAGRAAKMATDYILRKLVGMEEEQRRNMHVYLASATPTASSDRTSQMEMEPDRQFANWIKTFAIVAPVEDRYYTSGNPYQTMKRAFKDVNQGDFIQRFVTPLMIYVDQRFDLTQHACVNDTRVFVKATKWFYGALLHTLYVPRNGSDMRPKAYMEEMAGAMGIKLSSIKVLTKELKDAFRKRRMVVGILGQTIVHDWLISPKTAAIAKFIVTHKAKHVVYVQNSTQAKVLLHAIQSLYKYRIVNTDPALKTSSSYKGQRPGVILLDSGKKAPAVKRLFDDVGNDDGSAVRAVISTGAMYEGVNFETIRYVHMATPVRNALQEQQLSGRGVRLCAHERLPKNKREVTVIRWFLEPPPQKNIRILLQYLNKSGVRRSVVKPLEGLLKKVEKTMGSCANKGIDYWVREQYLSDPRALRMWNFERTMQTVLKGRAKLPQGKRILVVGGKQCQRK